MRADVLVLDRQYFPVSIVPWERSITLLWENKVQVLHEYEDRKVRSVSLEIAVPSVIRFINATRGRKKAVKFTRESIMARDRHQCQYCGKRLERREATYDHVIPRAQNGTTHFGNIVLACVPCNQKKANRTPAQANMVLLHKPVVPKNLSSDSRYLLEWRPGMPDSWRGFLRDQVASAEYWHGELESDEDVSP